MEGFAAGGTSPTHRPSTWAGRMGRFKVMQSQPQLHSQDLGSLCRPQSPSPEGQSRAPDHITPALQRTRRGRDMGQKPSAFSVNSSLPAPSVVTQPPQARWQVTFLSYHGSRVPRWATHNGPDRFALYNCTGCLVASPNKNSLD